MTIHIRRREFIGMVGGAAAIWPFMPQARTCGLLKLLLGLSFGVAAVGNAQAQQYPSHPITVVVPGAAGGPGDTLARLVAEPMRASLGQQIIIENVSGANGTIGTARVVRAAADGYTLSLGNWNSHMAASAFYPVQYDILKDLDPISLLTISRLWLVSKMSFPAKNAAELIAWLKANPNRASAATVGVGSATHVCGIHFQNTTGTQFQFVFYRSGAPAYQDLVAGHVDLMCAEASATLPLVREGKLKPYGVMAKTRWSAAPDVPTMEEVGAPGLHIPWWQGLWAPKGTSKEIIIKLNSAAVEALADARVGRLLSDVGLETPSQELRTPEGVRAFQKAEVERWWPIIKAAGIKPE
jgi:tripartite-type tricarboxylate transporter receptor subunit TctC